MSSHSFLFAALMLAGCRSESSIETDAERTLAAAWRRDAGAQRIFEHACTAEAADGVEEAIDGFQHVVELDARDVEGWCWLGHSWNRLERFEPAIEAYERALALDDSSAWTHYARAMARHKLGLERKDVALLERALEGYSAAIERDMRWTKPLDWRAFNLAILGRFEAALSDYDASLALDTRDAWVWYCRGNTHVALGELERARSDFERARAARLTDDPNQRREVQISEIEAALTWLDIARGQEASALQRLRAWCANGGADQAHARIALALLEARAGKPANEALDALRAWIRDTNDPEGFELRAAAFVAGEGDIESLRRAALAEEEQRAGPPLFGDALRCEAEYFAGVRAELEGRFDEARSFYAGAAAFAAPAKWEGWLAAAASRRLDAR